MSNYRRSKEGNLFFLTVVTEGRARILHSDIARASLRQAFRETRKQWSFDVEAVVLLEDHFHTLWTLPPGDLDYPKRLGYLKRHFTRMYLSQGGLERPVRLSKQHKRERGVWQRRFWEHTIQGEADYRQHMDYIHYNPVKHGLVRCPKEYPYSSFHRYVAKGVYEKEWGGGELEFTDVGGSEWE